MRPMEPRFPNNAGGESCVDLRLASLPEAVNPRGRRAHHFGTYLAPHNRGYLDADGYPLARRPAAT